MNRTELTAFGSTWIIGARQNSSCDWTGYVTRDNEMVYDGSMRYSDAAGAMANAFNWLHKEAKTLKDVAKAMGAAR